MGKREEFIGLLDKYELAFLYKYKISTYMTDTQKYIVDVMTSKGITIENIDDLIDEQLELAKRLSLGGCPRCHSDKFFYFDTVYDNMSKNAVTWDDKKFSTEMPTETNQECAVCGYNEKFEDSGIEKNQTLKYVLIALALMAGLARLIMWIFNL